MPLDRGRIGGRAVPLLQTVVGGLLATRLGNEISTSDDEDIRIVFVNFLTYTSHWQ